MFAGETPPGGYSVRAEEARLLALGELFLDGQQFTDAEAVFRNLAVMVPQQRAYRARMHFSRGHVHLQAGLRKLEFRRAIALDPTLPDAELALQRATTWWSRLRRL